MLGDLPINKVKDNKAQQVTLHNIGRCRLHPNLPVQPLALTAREIVLLVQVTHQTVDCFPIKRELRSIGGSDSDASRFVSIC